MTQHENDSLTIQALQEQVVLYEEFFYKQDSITTAYYEKSAEAFDKYQKDVNITLVFFMGVITILLIIVVALNRKLKEYREQNSQEP